MTPLERLKSLEKRREMLIGRIMTITYMLRDVDLSIVRIRAGLKAAATRKSRPPVPSPLSSETIHD